MGSVARSPEEGKSAPKRLKSSQACQACRKYIMSLPLFGSHDSNRHEEACLRWLTSLCEVQTGPERLCGSRFEREDSSYEEEDDRIRG